MQTIQVTIDEPLLAQVDQAIRDLKVTRSEFICEALKQTLRQHRITTLERKHEEGYFKRPPSEHELKEWAEEQCWERDESSNFFRLDTSPLKVMMFMVNLSATHALATGR